MTKGADLSRPKRRVFIPSDFGEIIQKVPEDCPLVGGQAVAWWAEYYGISSTRPLTSCDIDFWGFREDLQRLASALRRKPVYSHKYEMTAWVGGIPLEIKGERTIVEFLNTVPGLDVINPEKAAVGQVFGSGAKPKKLLVLSPVSLVLAKLHALRAYDQSERQDELHLKVCLVSSVAFIAQLLKNAEIKQVLWNVERLIAASQTKPYQRLEPRHNFRILSAVPIKELSSALHQLICPNRIVVGSICFSPKGGHACERSSDEDATAHVRRSRATYAPSNSSLNGNNSRSLSRWYSG